MNKGKVYIIGVGPGDYKLMTLRAADCIRNADAIVYDRLIDSRVLTFASQQAEFVNVGKQPEHHPVPQAEINTILARLAGEGKVVARVKGGDPFLFGRGGEECDFLQSQGIPFEIVPGVTSAIAVPAYAGIPVTHREYASSLHIITGHKSGENTGTGIDFAALARLEGTLVFLMGVKNIHEICSGLVKYGKPEDTPVAIIENGASSRQRVLAGTLGNILQKSVEAGVQSPAVIVVGLVAKLGERLAWFGKGPLAGKKIVVTRPKGQSEHLVHSLEELGAQVIELPAIKITEEEDCRPLQRALERIAEYKWLIFTSTNGVNMFFQQMSRLGKDIRQLAGLKLAVIGRATEQALQDKGLNVDFVPEKFTTPDLLKGLLPLVGQDEKVLIVKPEIARPELTDGFKRHGIPFDEIVVYKTLENNTITSELIHLIENTSIDFITFTSPSAAKAFASIAGSENMKNMTARIVCIGPVTANAAREIGLEVHGYADESIEDGIIKKLIELSEV